MIELARETSDDITSSVENWKNYLNTASRFYKYSFNDQIMIHAQRPDCTACASISIWNKKMLRWVKSGSKGIALIREQNQKPYLTYVFALEDTVTTKISKTPYLWRMEQRHHESVLAMLEQYEGNTEEKDIAKRLMEIAVSMVDNTDTTYFKNMLEDLEDTPLGELDQQEAQGIFREICIASIQYILLHRCGIDTSLYITEKDLQNSMMFTTPELLHHLGTAVNELSNGILRNIERTVKNDEKSIAVSNKKEYNSYKDEFSTLKHETKIKEGSFEHGRTKLYQSGELSDTRFGDGRRGGQQGTGQIRFDERRISQKEQQREIPLYAADGQTLESSAGNRPGSTTIRGESDRGNEENRRHNGGTQSKESNEMGTEGKQHSAKSRGNSQTGNDIYLEQRGSEKLSLFVYQYPKEFVLASFEHRAFLQKDWKEIADYFQFHTDEKERSDFLATAYKKDTIETEINGIPIGFAYGEKGLLYWSGAEDNKISQAFCTWDFMQKAVALILKFQKRHQKLPAMEQQAETIEKAEKEQQSAFFVSEKEAEQITLDLDSERDFNIQPSQENLLQKDMISNKEKQTPEMLYVQDLQRKSKPLKHDVLKQKYPEYCIGVETEGAYQFYGKDAEIIAKQLGREIMKHMGESTALETPLSLEEVKIVSQKQNILLTDTKEYIPLLNEIEIDGRRCKVDSIDFSTGRMNLLDIELKGWFPIFIDEKISVVREQIEKQFNAAKKTQVTESIEQEKELEKDIPKKLNFQITDDFIVSGGKKTKCQQNIDAIRLLKELEKENKLANTQQQQILCKYVGWGGLAEAFDSQNEKWSKEYAQLKEVLTPKEYDFAKASTLNAHYTSTVVIKAMYQAVETMDLPLKNVLEPACGIGNFFGLVPENRKDTNLYGVELDSITGRIAKQLYQKANITIDGFEKTNFKDDFFDVAIGNVPFGSYKVADKKYEKYNFLIHDYFFAKALDKVKTGGIVAFITSKGTLDKANDSVRRYLAEKADLLGAIRLPNNAFFENAGTEVTTDILFLQKREAPPEKQPSWVQIGTLENGIAVNNYFVENPHMILGKMAHWSNMYGNEKETACLPIEGAVLEEQLQQAITYISLPNKELFQKVEMEELEETAEVLPAEESVRNFSYTVIEEKKNIFFRENDFMYPVSCKESEKERIKGMIDIRDTTRRLIELQLYGENEQEIGSEQQHLNHIYDAFHRKYGVINGKTNKKLFQKDSSYPLLCSLEIIDEEGNLERKADMFTKRTIKKYVPVTHVDTAIDALAVSISEKACVDIAFMAELMGGSEKTEKMIKELQQQEMIFKTPQSGSIWENREIGWQTADEYLSGNVIEKLEYAQAMAEKYPEFEINVTALEKVQPKELEAAEIGVRIGSSWIAPKYYKQFLFELLETPRYQTYNIDVMYSHATNIWNVKGKSVDANNTHAFVTYGTSRISAYAIFEKTLNQQDIKIYDTIEENGTEKRVLNTKETTIAQQKQEVMEQAFQEWIWKDPKRRRTLCQQYNREFNCISPRKYDGRYIAFAGMNPEITLQPHQKNGVARVLYGQNALLAYCVGAGKSATRS